MNTNTSTRWHPLVGVVAVWTPAMIAASYVWSHGEYYDYGWFVPPAMLWLLIRRWWELDGPIQVPRRKPVLMLAAVLLPWILMLRVLGYADPSWRIPLTLLGLTAAVISHSLIASACGWRVSANFAWITLLGMSALPWPSVVEIRIVNQLTHGVIIAVAEIFQFLGKPVEVLGNRLCLHDLTVEVTDGCSGVRSFQSFLMASWFFIELQRLRVSRALFLLACTCCVAFLVNMARVFALAQIRFINGQEAFDHAHDWIGLLAFVVSGLFFYFLSGGLSTVPRQVVVRTLGRALE